MDRALSLAIAFVAGAALVAQAVVTWRVLGAEATAPALIWSLAGYFTVLTNLLIVLVLAGAGVRGRRAPPVVAGALTLAIALVGVVYHALLAGLWAPQGLAWWADQGLHSAVPALTVIWWVAAARKDELSSRAPVWWLLWPALYLVYAMLRGLATGWYAYPFLDLDALGAGRVAANTLAILVVLLAAGFAMLGLARWLDRPVAEA